MREKTWKFEGELMLIKKWFKEAFEDTKPQGVCLTEGDIACVLEGVLTQRQRKRLVKHINSCASCADLLKKHLYLERVAGKDHPLIEPPRNFVESAKAIVPR